MAFTLGFKPPARFKGKIIPRAPVTVVNHNLEIVARTSLGGNVTLGPGAYAATAFLPDGRELTAAFRVPESGDCDPIELRERASTPPFAAMSWQSEMADASDFQRLKSVPGIGPEFASFQRVTASSATARFQLLRLVNGALEPATQPVPIQSTELRLEPSAEQRVLRIMRQDKADLNVRVPTSPLEGATAWLPYGDEQLFRIELDDDNAELLLAYFAGNQFPELSQMAKELLSDKASAPVAAAVGGYVLASIATVGETERAADGSPWLDQWTLNLLGMHPWLPDGLCIRGEVLARRGLHKESLELLLQLPFRGLPIFSLGLRLTLERLGSYARLIDAGKLPRDRAVDIETLLSELSPLASFVDFGQPLLTYTTNPDGSPGREPRT